MPYTSALHAPLRFALPLLMGVLLAGPAVGPACAQAPDTTEQAPLYRVETTSGQTLIGTIVSETDDTVVLDTRELGEVRLDRSTVARLTQIDPDRLRDGQYWYPNPQSTRYFFAPNALGIPQGEGYYQNTWVLLNNVNYGVSDHFSLGGGTVPLFLFGAEIVPVWILPKVSFPGPRDRVHLAGGAVLGGVFGDEGGGGASLLYGSATVGSRDRNATLGVGYGYADGSLTETPAVTLSGMTRVGQSLYLVTENYIFPGPETATVVSAGVRWAPENFAVDFALFRPLSGDTGGVFGLPWLGITIPFGT
jgi:hypothetical protein